MSAIYDMARQSWREMHNAWVDMREAQYAQAEEATNGYMVSREGRSRGFTGYDLYNMPVTVARRYASEELLAWWASHPRMTLSEFERQWVQARDEREVA